VIRIITPDQHVYIMTNFADNSMIGNELKGVAGNTSIRGIGGGRDLNQWTSLSASAARAGKSSNLSRSNAMRRDHMA
jgi:hypothetical protein